MSGLGLMPYMQPSNAKGARLVHDGDRAGTGGRSLVDHVLAINTILEQCCRHCGLLTWCHSNVQSVAPRQ